MNPFKNGETQGLPKWEAIKLMPEEEAWRVRLQPEDVEPYRPGLAGVLREVNEKSRKPCIEDGWFEKTSVKQVERAWGLVSQAIMEEIKSSDACREKARSFLQAPVSEELCFKFFEAMREASPRVAKLARIFQKTLGDFLSRSAVPEELIEPDLSYSDRRYDIQSRIRAHALNRSFSSEEEEIRSIRSNLECGRCNLLTPEEAAMVLIRFKFARDVKLMALGAQMMDHEPLASVVDEEEGLQSMVLDSGIKITADSSKLARADIGKMLNPFNWEKRRQIKDRTWEIVVDGKRFILKEKKTARHKDTMKHGHRAGRSSFEEFMIARDFEKRGQRQEGRVFLDWEKPIGAVCFEDGFQFTVYECHEDLVKAQEHPQVMSDLENIILERLAEFAEEYDLVAKLAESYLLDERLKDGFFNSERGEDLTQRVLSVMRGRRTLTPEMFAKIKARCLAERAREMQDSVISELGYKNGDRDEYVYSIVKEPKVGLRLIGFDFEYFNVGPRRQSTEIGWLEAINDKNQRFRSDESRLEAAVYLVLRDLNKNLRARAAN